MGKEKGRGREGERRHICSGLGRLGKRLLHKTDGLSSDPQNLKKKPSWQHVYNITIGFSEDR